MSNWQVRHRLGCSFPVSSADFWLCLRKFCGQADRGRLAGQRREFKFHRKSAAQYSTYTHSEELRPLKQIWHRTQHGIRPHGAHAGLNPHRRAARLGIRRPAVRQLRLVESPAPSGCRFSLPDGWCVPRRARITSAPRTDGQDGRGRQAGVGPAQLRSAAPRNKLAGHGWSSATACSVWRRFGRGGLSEEQGGFTPLHCSRCSRN